MTRVVIESVLLFLLPFGAFFVWLALRRRSPGAREEWSPALTWLVIGSFLYTFASADRRMGGYEPAHVENGVLVPGRVQ